MTFVLFIREKLQELNNELLKKNSFIEEMEPKYNTSSESGPLLNSDPSVLLVSNSKPFNVVDSQPSEWKSWKML